MQRLCFFLLLLVTTLFFSPSAVAFTTYDASADEVVVLEQHHLRAIDIVGAISDQPFHSSNPLRSPLEEPQETELSKKEKVLDGDLVTVWEDYLATYRLDTSRHKPFLQRQLQRNQLPLYILFHAWKSYLA